MGHNRAGENRKKRLKRRKKQEQQLAKTKLRQEEVVGSLHIKTSGNDTYFLRNKDFDSVEWGLPKPMPFSQGVKFLAKLFGCKNPKTVKEVERSPTPQGDEIVDDDWGDN